MTPPRPVQNSNSQYHQQNHENAGSSGRRTFRSVPRLPNCGPVHMGVIHDEARQMSYVGPVRECILTLHRSGSQSLIRFSAAVQGAIVGARAGNAARRSSQATPGVPPRPPVPSPQNSPTPPPTNRSSSNSSSSNAGWLDPFILGTTVVLRDFNEMMGWNRWTQASPAERVVIAVRTGLLFSFSPFPILLGHSLLRGE